jgi:predicted CoA-substrate-specific enzyme activase
MLSAGIDAGSRAIKIVFRDAGNGSVLTSGITDQGVAQDRLAGDLFDRLLREMGRTREDVGRTVATGYGRARIGFADTTITEISCHARGARHLRPGVRTVIDIGGQDSKVIRLDPDGSVRDFVMNDRCAAGTGRFLEVVAGRLDVDLSDLGSLAGRSGSPATISSMCVVFAETEIVGLLASGVPPEDIAAGVQASIAKRVSGMAGGRVETPVLLTGGVALLPGFADSLERVLGVGVGVPPEPQYAGALGASLLAASFR